MVMITDAIRQAQTEHVVYFLLTAYVESRAHDDESGGLPAEVKRLPIAGNGDLAQRVLALSAASAMSAPDSDSTSAMTREALEVLTAASQRLVALGPQRDG